ncbi:MAG: GntR family transcriptional regulator [Candidatus Pseudobacter hemicellulosilyticus]|uniref:GntR family transcriptional regulator n=1 Tax=Candidatus Pseudobacter hemicellulosilyticus TaxID=3121375 RepID=A0AAJ5WNY9_9BACT|nr:MAG: GntR family transcriptional regulator [Pseudobacter sp.]
MKTSIFDLIDIDVYSASPKYMQLVNCILNAIQLEKLKKDDPLPSINEVTYEVDMSKATVEKSYRYLRTMGIVESVPGKGFFVCSTSIRQEYRVFLLFNKLSAHKKIIYDAFVETLGDKALIDFYIYNNDLRLFKKYITDKLDQYTHYVIIPHFIDGEEFAPGILNLIPKDKLILLDKGLSGVRGDYAAVYENFQQDIYGALTAALERLQTYQRLKIIFPEDSYYPQEILEGFYRFCQEHAFAAKLVSNILDEPIEPGDVYISLMEDDLVTLIEKVLEKQLAIGREVGIISYNETPIKRVLLNGITTISTDFSLMGKMAAQLILTDEKQHLEVPFRLVLRASL